MLAKMSRTKKIMLRYFALCYAVCIPTLIYGENDVSTLSRPEGRVSLFSFERGHLRTITDVVDSEVVISVQPRYFEAYLFECNATYPVQWAYIGEGSPVVTADVGRFFKDFYDVNTYTYQSILLMYSLQELQSGRYICRGASKEHDKLSIHYDVFVPGNATQILLSTSEKKLFVAETKEHAYIPCGVSDSTAAVTLYRGNQWGTFYPVPTNGSISYNPRKGFKIRFKDFLDPWGTYLCVSDGNKKRRKVHLIPESLKGKYEQLNHVDGKIPVYFSYEYEYNRVLCCTGTNFIPKLQWAGCGSILDCQVKSACFEEDRCEQRLGNSGYNPTKWIDPGPLPPGCSGYRLRDDPNGDFGLFKCSTPGIAQYQPYLLNRGNIFLDFEKTPPSEMILTLQRITREGPSFVGDEVEFHCNSTRFYFAYGIRWGWEKIDGEIEFIDDSSVVRDKYSIRGHRRRTILRIPSTDIKSVICFVPVVNSATEWRTVSLPVVIASNDANFISPQNSGPNVIDLDSLTYHTDYDTSNTPNVQPQNVLPQQPPQGNAQYESPPVHQQAYQSAKTPYESIQAIVPISPVPSTTAEHQPQHQVNPNYYSYAHDSSRDTTHLPHIQTIPNSIQHLQIQNNDIQSHQSSIHPVSRPHTVDIYAQPQTLRSTDAATASQSTISIPRSKRIRNRPSGGASSSSSILASTGGRSVPNIKPDILYDTDKDYSLSSYETFEPRPSSSNPSTRHRGRLQSQYITSNSPMHASSSRMPSYNDKSTSYSHDSTKSPFHSTSRKQGHTRNDIMYSSPKKSYRDYNTYNGNSQYSRDTRLSLPFEPAMPSRTRYGHSSNYSTIPSSVRDTHTGHSDSESVRSRTRRPISNNYSGTSSQTVQDGNHNQPRMKAYSIDNSYSQHVRLTVPSNSIGTISPSYQLKSRIRSHQTNHAGHGRAASSHASADKISNPKGSHQNVDYYYKDESQVGSKNKVARTKSQNSYANQTPVELSGGTLPHHHSYSVNDERNSRIAEPQVNHATTLPRSSSRRRTSSTDAANYNTNSQTTRASHQQHIYRQDDSTHVGHGHSSSDSVISSNHQSRHYPQEKVEPLQQSYQPANHHYSGSSRSSSGSRGGRHRSRGRGLKFDANQDTQEGGTAIDAYEFTSPTARPSYFLSTPQNSNEYIEAADMDLKRVQTQHRARPRVKSTNKRNNSSDILHSVSISISSKISHNLDDDKTDEFNDNDENDNSPQVQDNHVGQSARDLEKTEDDETEDYDIYSPQYTNYKVTTVPAPVTIKPTVPIQFFVKPTDMSSFQPAKTTIDEDDEYDAR